MKQREKENLKNLTVAELNTELRQAKEKQFGLMFKHNTTPVANPLEIRSLRRRIATLETFIRAKAAAPAAKKA